MLTGEGDKAFCSGGDLMGLYKANQSLPEEKRTFWKDFPRAEYLADYSMTKLDSTRVVFWDGIVMGGGVGIS